MRRKIKKARISTRERTASLDRKKGEAKDGEEKEEEKEVPKGRERT